MKIRRRFAVFSFLLAAFSTIHPHLLRAADDLPALLFKITGSVQVQARGAGAWKRARAGMGLAENDVLRAEAASLAHILLDDGSVFRLKGPCELQLSRLKRDRKTRAMGSEFDLRRGLMLGRVARQTGNAKAEFRSPTAVVAVRGTELAMDVQDDGSTEVLVAEGRVVVRDFVEERGLPQSQDELMLEVLHEVSVRSGEWTRVTKDGVARARKDDARAKKLEAEFASLREESQAAAAQQASENFEKSQQRRSAEREEALR